MIQRDCRRRNKGRRKEGDMGEEGQVRKREERGRWEGRRGKTEDEGESIE